MLTELAPYRETGYQLLMQALAGRGNVAEALRACEQLRLLLREELGITPSPHRGRHPPSAAAERRQLELLGLREKVFPRNIADQLGMQDDHMVLGVPPELIFIITLDGIPAHAGHPQRHCQPPGHRRRRSRRVAVEGAQTAPYPVTSCMRHFRRKT
jgi:hypothetical protein